MRLSSSLTATVALVLGVCSALASAAHAEDDRVTKAYPSWGIELGAGTATNQGGPYITRLGDFGFGGDESSSGARLHVALDRRVRHYFALGLAYDYLESYEFTRDQESSQARLVPGTFEWDTRTVSAYGRAGYPVIPELYPFVHLGLGAAWTRSELALEGASLSEDTEWGPMATVGIGLHVASPHFGLAFSYVHTFASVLENQLGDEHDSSASYMLVALRFQVMEDEL